MLLDNLLLQRKGGMHTAYRRASALTGALQETSHVRYVPTLDRHDRAKLYLWGGVLSLSSLALMGWIFSGITMSVTVIVAVFLTVFVEVIRVFQTITLWLFAHWASDPVPMIPRRGMRVAVHTTIVPGKEPFDIVSTTLLAMKRMHYDGRVDVWLLDEGNNPEIREWCEHNGVLHFSRKGTAQWNTPAGKFKAKTKHGNLNSFHAMYGYRYHVVAQMDPDHVPSPDFLERTLGYFADPNVGFVVAPQVYGNLRESFIARASAFQAYVFHGIIQRGGNGLRAPLLIGTNHLVRTQALRDVNGYADNIIEDHLTSMAMFAKKNKQGVYWKGVYTPDIVSVGEGPTSFTDYFNQQKRWAYGIWEIAQKHSPNMFGGMRSAQRLAFTMLQFFYPSVAVSWVLSFLLSTLYMIGFAEGNSPDGWAVIWGISMASSISFFLWLRKFNLVEHERKDWGIGGMTLLLMCIPVYVSAGVQALMRRPLSYAVTAKGDLASPDNLRTFAPHLVWVSLVAGLLGVNIAGVGPSLTSGRLWLLWSLIVCLLPLMAHAGLKARQSLDNFQQSLADKSVSNFVPLRELMEVE